MAWSKMIVPNPIIVDAAGTAGSGYVIKAYLAGTTTSTSIAIDSAGSSPQTSITANSNGIWEVSGNEIEPYIDRKHKYAIFANATDAAANTPAYMGFFDNVEQVLNSTDGATATQELTTATMAAHTNKTYVAGDFIETAEFATGTGGGAKYKAVLTSSVTPNTRGIIVGTGSVANALISFVLEIEIEPHIRQFGGTWDASVDNTILINNVIGDLGDDTTLDMRGISTIITGQASTAPDDFASSDGDSSPDVPTNSGILLRGRDKIKILVDGSTFTTSTVDTLIFSMYKSVSCSVRGEATYTQTGSITTEQPSAICMVRCLDCHESGNRSSGWYRGVFILRCAYSSSEDFKISAGEYYSMYISSVLDVAVGWSATLSNLEFTNWCRDGSVTTSEYGSYFLEYATAFNCYAYDADNANVACVHFSAQVAPYRVVNCHVIDSSNQNSGNSITGFSVSPTSSAVSTLPLNRTRLTGCTTDGCLVGFAGSGFRDVVFTDCRAFDYYLTGFAFITSSSGGTYSIEDLNLIGCSAGNISASSTVTVAGNQKKAGFQFEKNNSVAFTDISVIGGFSDLDNAGAISPTGTTYEVYTEGVEVDVSKFKVRGTQTVLGSEFFTARGNLTPTVTMGGAAVGLTYAIQSLDYREDNGICHFWGIIRLSAKGSSTGDLVIVTGLPNLPNPTSASALLPVTITSSSWLSAPTKPTGVVNPSTGGILMYTTNTAFTSIDDTHVGAATEINFSGSFNI